MASQKFTGLYISNYRLIEQIGSGGFSHIYRAQDVETGEVVAIKFLRSRYLKDWTTIERFKREALTLNALNHPNIIRMKETNWNEEVGFFLVLEWLNGKTLKEYLANQEKPFSLGEVMFIFEQLLAGLGEAHRHGIIHRDIKPANMMFVAEERSSLLKILDFGIARLLGLESKITTPGMVMGSAHYMAPEQALGRADEIDHRSDLYSCGCLLAECLTGKTPFKGNVYEVAFLHHRGVPIPKLKELYPEGHFSEDLEQIFAKSIARDKAQRFQSTKEFLEALRFVAATEELQEEEPTLTFEEETTTEEYASYHASLDELSELILTASQDGLYATFEDLPSGASFVDTLEDEKSDDSVDTVEVSGKSTVPIIIKAERFLLSAPEAALPQFEGSEPVTTDEFDLLGKTPVVPTKNRTFEETKTTNPDLEKTMDLGLLSQDVRRAEEAHEEAQVKLSESEKKLSQDVPLNSIIVTMEVPEGEEKELVELLKSKRKKFSQVAFLEQIDWPDEEKKKKE